MKLAPIAILALGLSSSVVFADEPVSDAEADAIQNALEAWGCAGGEMGKEPGHHYLFEVDDAECDAGEYDFKLDKEFKVLLIGRG